MADLYTEKPKTCAMVTDFEYIDGNNQPRIGYNMNRILWNNVRQIPKYLARDNSMVIIVSGSGLWRTGKSTLANQIAYAAAWSIAGGEQDEQDNVIKKPKGEVKVKIFYDTISLSNDLAQTEDDYQIYVLDESEEGAASRSAMNRRNKDFRDIITRSAMKKIVLILVLPDFFNLSHHWACVVSDCLINCFTVHGKRGYFNFYDRAAKERLYYFGKKKIGAERYSHTTSWPVFGGTFSKTWPGNYEEYITNKKLAINKLRTTVRVKSTQERDHLIKALREKMGLSYAQISELSGFNEDIIKYAVIRENRRRALAANAEPLPEEEIEDPNKDAADVFVDDYNVTKKDFRTAGFFKPDVEGGIEDGDKGRESPTG